MPDMRAKFYIQSVTRYSKVQETLALSAVGSAKYGPNGESEDNTFARYTPAGTLSLTITNPDLIGKFEPGEKFYLDFTKAAE